MNVQKERYKSIDTMAKQANLSDKDIQEITNKLDDMFKNLSVNMDDIDEEQLSEMMNPDNLDNDEQAKGMPLGSIFSGIFGITPNNNEDSSKYANSNSTQKLRKRLR